MRLRRSPLRIGLPASPIRLVKIVGDRLVHLREQVTVAVVGLLDGRVAEADLHGLGVGVAEVDGERDGGVAEVVDPQAGQACRPDCRQPVVQAEAGPVPRATSRVREDEIVPADRWQAEILTECFEVGEVLLQQHGHERRHPHGPPAGRRLEGLGEVELVVDLGELLLDSDRAPAGVNVLALQADGLAPAEPAVRQHVHEHLRVGIDGFGELVDLGD